MDLLLVIIMLQLKQHFKDYQLLILKCQLKMHTHKHLIQEWTCKWLMEVLDGMKQ